MNYNETLDFLFSQLPMYQRVGKAAYKADLENTIELDNYFGNPHKNFKTIHIAGTNGKGSTSHMIASVLQNAGYKTGLYTSPHLRDFRERIKVNGDPVSEQEVIGFVENHRETIERVQPSFFEMTVAMAFDYFNRQKVDVAIIEVGMGGRLDSTNIIQPEVSVITNIGLDHTQFLGDTLAKVAAEKGGIIKKDVTVIIGEQHDETSSVFEAIAKERGTELIWAEDKYHVQYAMQTIDFKQVFNVYKSNDVVFDNLKLDLLGMYQKKNMVTALVAIEQIKLKGFEISRENIYNGLESAAKTTGLMGRWQVLNSQPLTICDTGHNEDGLNFILQQLKQTPYKQLHFVIGMVDDKNIDKVLERLPKDAIYYFVQATIPRALKKELLFEKAQKFNLKGEIYNSVEEGLKKAKKVAGDNDLIFIGGSTFVVAEVV